MYNLLMTCDWEQVYWKNNSICQYSIDRLFEYTDYSIKKNMKVI